MGGGLLLGWARLTRQVVTQRILAHIATEILRGNAAYSANRVSAPLSIPLTNPAADASDEAGQAAEVTTGAAAEVTTGTSEPPKVAVSSDDDGEGSSSDAE